MRQPVHLPEPEPEPERPALPPEVAQALEDYLVEILLADLALDDAPEPPPNAPH